MYYIAICDDDMSFIKYLKDRLLQSGWTKEEVMFYEFLSGEELTKSLDSLRRVDLLIMDMRLNGMDGNEAARHFRQRFPIAILVFCSGVCQPTVENFEVTPFRFLLKEYSDDKFLKELENIKHEVKSKNIQPRISGKYRSDEILLRINEILYIEKVRNKRCIVHADLFIEGKRSTVKLKNGKELDELYEELKNYGFEYAHNSYIVNLYHVRRKNSKEVELSDGTVLSVSRSKERVLKAALARFMSLKY